jgi:NADH-quinone oxidoreductase subunit N
MNLSTSVIALLPEYVLTLTGVLIMLVEAVLKPATSRKPLGWLAIAGTTAAGFISYYQLRLGTLKAFRSMLSAYSFIY